MKKQTLRIAYIVSDLITSAMAWSAFFFFRKIVIEKKLFGPELPVTPDNRFYIGLVTIPVFWFILHYISGFYTHPQRKSRLTDLGQTFSITLLGTVILFFALILDDVISRYTNYYLSFAALFSLQFILSYIPRFIITSSTVHKVHRGILGFNTIIIGCNGRATDIYKKIINQKKSTGNRFVGYVTVSEPSACKLDRYLPRLGRLEELNSIVKETGAEEVIIAIEPGENNIIGRILNVLNNHNIIIKAIPGMHDILLGRIRTSAIFGTPLILLNPDPMPVWQRNIKQLSDYILSLSAFIILLPLSAGLAVMIRMSGKGPLIYKQERIGQHGKPFMLYKFRSMHADAEKDGPMLSSHDDPRITRVGKFMRRHRLDEIPNFINVLKGEMSVVGPRPERACYLEKIIAEAPRYKLLFRIKPGITSWGQVKFGYASDTEGMIERLDYDLIYLDNMSLYVDLKIIIYTTIIVFRGSGI